MNKKKEIIIDVCILVLLILTIVFLSISIFGRKGNSIELMIALGCTALGNILIFIKNRMIEKNKNK